RLIAFLVLRLVGAPDVGRQRYMAIPLQPRFIDGRGKLEKTALAVPGFEASGDAFRKTEDCSPFEPASPACDRLPAVSSVFFEKNELRRSAPAAPAKEPRLSDTCVVEHDKRPGLDPWREIFHDRMRDFPCNPVQDEEPGRFTFRRR